MHLYDYSRICDFHNNCTVIILMGIFSLFKAYKEITMPPVLARFVFPFIDYLSDTWMGTTALMRFVASSVCCVLILILHVVYIACSHLIQDLLRLWYVVYLCSIACPQIIVVIMQGGLPNRLITDNFDHTRGLKYFNRIKRILGCMVTLTNFVNIICFFPFRDVQSRTRDNVRNIS